MSKNLRDIILSLNELDTKNSERLLKLKRKYLKLINMPYYYGDENGINNPKYLKYKQIVERISEILIERKNK